MAKQVILAGDNGNEGRQKINSNFDELYGNGSWTPVIYGSSTPGSPTYTVQSGLYKRIGDTVIAGFSITLSATGGIVGDVLISGLPYASISNVLYAVNIPLYYVNLSGGYTGLSGTVPSGGSAIRLYKTGNNLSSSFVQGTDLLAATVLRGTATYVAAAL